MTDHTGAPSSGQIGNDGKGALFKGFHYSYPYQLLSVQVLDNVKMVTADSSTTYAIRNDDLSGAGATTKMVFGATERTSVSGML